MKYMNTNILSKLISICFITLLAANFVSGQNGTQNRSITSDAFASKRPAKTNETGKNNVNLRTKSFTYRFVRADKNVVRRKHSRKDPISGASPKNAQPKITEIGVTMWKMRPPKVNEAGYLMSVLDDKKLRQMWLAERVGVDTIFNAGDKIRFAVESSDSGYLYVLGRETYSDGSFGVPYPIFPASSADDNSLRPGMLFDFPDQREDLPYLMLVPKKPNYSGELVTIVISPKPLTIMKTDQDGNLRDSDNLSDLEFGADVEIFSRTDTADKLYSKTESAAACGVKARELVREKSAGRPCGNTSSQMTREDPLPQSIYRVKTLIGHPSVTFIRLGVR